MERLNELFHEYYNKTLQDQDREDLMQFIRSASEEDLSRLIMEAGKDLNVAEFSIDEENAELMLQKIFNRRTAQVRKINRVTIGWFRIAIAASVIGLLILGGYWLLKPGLDIESQKSEIAKKEEVKAPETNTAMITLANGQKIYLNNAANGILIQQKGIEIVKMADGKIAYNGTTTDIVYNTLSNPRGSKVIDMTLSDGSRVWLNAGSSVTFPLSFIGNERKVSITGEAYFEVMHDKVRPFYVSKGEIQVKVLGTHFNVNAYEDETVIKVTLLEGSVNVSVKADSLTLQPRQQAIVKQNESLILNKSVDLENVMAWKNGLFSFSRDNIQTVMRQLAKWYDLDVEFQGNITPDQFGGDISRSLPLNEVLEFLKASQVNFEVHGKRVIVKP